MFRNLHHLLFGLLLLAAALVGAAGWRLSMHAEQQRVPQDRGPLNEAAGHIQQSLNKLEAAYTEHLRDLVAGLKPDEELSTKAACERLVGIARCSLLHRKEAGRIDSHIDIATTLAAALPRPALWQRNSERGPLTLITLDAATGDGWLENSARPLLYIRVPDARLTTPGERSVIALSVIADEVAAAMTQSLRDDIHLPPAALLHQLIAPDGAVIVSVGKASASDSIADSVQPLPTRFGAWRIESWDARREVIIIDRALRISSMIAAMVLALIGLATWWHQRQSSQRAQQRVSFVNQVSHELRTPLTNLLLNLDLASEDLPAHPRLDHVHQEAARLGRLIDNVLTFSRAEQGKLELHAHPCDISAVIRSIVAIFQPLLDRRGIIFSTQLDLPPTLILDADALTQIIANLLSNIEKYAPYSPATLTASIKNEHLIIIATDNGPGIPQAESQRIFEPFVRLGNTVTEGVSGTGLGLAIARDLAQRMGGQLLFVPTERGACFKLDVTLPP